MTLANLAPAFDAYDAALSERYGPDPARAATRALIGRLAPLKPAAAHKGLRAALASAAALDGERPGAVASGQAAAELRAAIGIWSGVGAKKTLITAAEKLAATLDEEPARALDALLDGFDAALAASAPKPKKPRAENPQVPAFIARFAAAPKTRRDYILVLADMKRAGPELPAKDWVAVMRAVVGGPMRSKKDADDAFRKLLTTFDQAEMAKRGVDRAFASGY